MFFPRQNILLERLPDLSPLSSLCANPDFLALFKRHCALPTDASVTEYDLQLAMYADAAEKFIDLHSNTPYRPRTFQLSLTGTACSNGSASKAVGFTSIRLPFGPVAEVPEVKYVDDNDDETILTVDEDFKFVGGYSLSPEIVFFKEFQWPTLTKHPYPFQVTFTTSADEVNSIQKLAILSLGTFYYTNPSAMGEESPNTGDKMFWAMVNSLKVSFL